MGLKRRAWCWMLLAALGLPGALWAADEAAPPISVKAEVSRAFLTIGDPVEYTVSIRHAPGVKILSNLPVPPERVFNIKSVKDFNREEDGQIIKGRTMTLTTYRLGEFVLDPVTIEYRDENGKIGSIETQKLYLTVESVAKGEQKQDIRDLKSVLSIPLRVRRLLFAGAAAAAVLGGLLLFFYLKRRRAVAVSEPAVKLTPEEEAYHRLNDLFDSDLIKRGQYKPYFMQLSEILRFYFEKRFSILAVESTTDEILRDLKKERVDSALIGMIREVLETADLAKFAKFRPEPSEIMKVNKHSTAIVTAAKPREGGRDL